MSDNQVPGVDIFDAYATVVQWLTVRMMLLLSQVTQNKVWYDLYESTNMCNISFQL